VTHVLLPAWCLLWRADEAGVIGAALEAAAAGGGHRKIAGLLGRPASTAAADAEGRGNHCGGGAGTAAAVIGTAAIVRHARKKNRA
jgi:hypothetical protein